MRPMQSALLDIYISDAPICFSVYAKDIFGCNHSKTMFFPQYWAHFDNWRFGARVCQAEDLMVTQRYILHQSCLIFSTNAVISQFSDVDW